MAKSKSDAYLRQRGLPPVITPKMAKGVSEYRRATLEQEMDEGAFRESNLPTRYKTAGKYSTSDAGNVISSAKLFKTANTTGLGEAAGSSGFRGQTGSIRQVPEIYSPLWLTSNLNLPRDRATINAWSRSFFALNPMVHNAINLHSTYPISKLTIKCKNQKVQNFFEAMNDEIGLMNVCTQIAQEYWLLGEAVVYAEMDEAAGKWSRILIQNPDYITIRRSVVAGDPIISLRPDENLKRIVMSNRPADVQQRQQLDPSVIEHVKRGENIPLSPLYASHIPRKIAPYETRGTGLVVSCFRQLMLFDKLRESKFAQADNMINPLTLVKIGGGGENYKPTPADLEAWRTVFEDAQYDKDFKIFTHDAVAVERVGYNSGIIDISADITQLLKEIYIGLMVPQVIMDGGADVTYANGGVTLDVLRQRYMQFRNKLSHWLRTRIFAPISRINEFYEYKDGEKVLIVPEVEWNHMSLFDMGDYIQNLANLIQGEPAKLSLQTLYRSLGLDWDSEKRNMKMEAIQLAIAEKEKQSLMAMPLNDLRALGPDDEIPEVAAEPLPGEVPPGEEGMGMEMGGPPGGLPGMPPPPGGPPGEMGAPPEAGGEAPPPPPGGEAGGGAGGGPPV